MKKVEEKAAFCHFPSGDQKGQAHGIIEAPCLESWRINEHAALIVTNIALQTLEKKSLNKKEVSHQKVSHYNIPPKQGRGRITAGKSSHAPR